MRRWALLLGGAALWLFLAALPALADGGAHVAATNSGSSTLTADSCAGCHRAHTAQGQYLTNAPTEEALCLTCHGAQSTGATTDVITGVQYVSGAQHNVAGGLGTKLGALRDGGFEQARLATGSPIRLSYNRGINATTGQPDVSTRPTVRVGGPLPVTSSHLPALSGLTGAGKAWGNGANGAVGSPVVTLECTSCHNPHGNGQYRILNPMPTNGGATNPAVAYGVKSTDGTADLITTAVGHEFQVGDLVTISGVTGVANGDYVVWAVPNGITLKVQTVALGIGATTPYHVTTSGGAVGTIKRTSAPVADFGTPDADGNIPTKNYTVLQIKGGQGLDASYLLYASQITDARLAGDVVSSAAVTLDATPSGGAVFPPTSPASDVNDNVFQTIAPHGLSVGDIVRFTGAISPIANATDYVVSSVPQANQFKIINSAGSSVKFATTATPIAATVKRNDITAYDFSDTSGDYLHRTVPWNPGPINPACSSTASTSSSDTGGSANAARCGAANDAPNGQPNTVAVGPTAGEVAFSTQITAWCTTCHTRYYANENPNPSGSDPGTSAPTAASISYVFTAGNLIYTDKSHGFVVGDSVTIAGISSEIAASTYVVATVPTSSSFTLTGVTIGADVAYAKPYPGTARRQAAPQSASSWWFPRVGDSTYKFQHRTVPNRACVTCHVAHGSNAVMDGEYSSTFTYPDGQVHPDATSGRTSSRLLKVDNRGTCQMCHDPTGTITVGTLLPGGSPIVLP